MKRSLKICLSIIFSILMFASPLAIGLLCEKNNVIDSSNTPQQALSQDSQTSEAIALPSEYTEVEYIKSTKQQYLDTNIFPSNTTEIVMKVDFKNEETITSSSNHVFLGTNDAERKMYFSSNFGSAASQNNTIYNWCDVGNSNGERVVEIKIPAETQRVPEIFVKRSGFVSYGSKQYTTDTTTYERMPTPIVLFGSYTPNRGGYLAFTRYDMYLYYCKIYDNGQTVRDYVPCVRNSDSVAGLYDRISQEFFVSGTGVGFVGSGQEDNTRPKIRSFNDYFVDKNISYTTTKDDLLGDGSQENPWIVKSTEAFLYLTKNNNFTKKYIEFECDIILNEETFDEEGNPIGGDGIVYKWSSLNAHSCYIDGKGHSLVGLYMIGSANFSFIGYNTAAVGAFSNLNLKNAYVNGTQHCVSALAFKVSLVENCHFMSGFVSGLNQVGGLATHATKVVGCSNRATVVGGSSGGVAYQVSQIHDSINYGKVYSNGRNYVGGVVSETKFMKNCKNYGEIGSATSPFVGGLCSIGLVGGFQAINCENHGTVTASNFVASFVAIIRKDAEFIDCKNYAPANNGKGVQLARANDQSTIKIKNCVFDTREKVGALFSESVKKLIIDGCVVNVYKSTALNYNLLTCNKAEEIVINNLDVNLLSKDVSFTLISIVNPKINHVEIGNINIYSTKTNSVFKQLYNKTINMEITRGIVINTTTQKMFYGSDFSGFYKSWKTGKIGLTALDGKGLFQNKLKEETLEKEGYVDMTPDADEKYTQLEYLQGTGTQWIDVGYTPNINTKIEAEIAVSGNTNNAMGMNYSGYSGNVSFGASGEFLMASFGATTNNTVLKIPFDTEFHSYSISKEKIQIDSQSITPAYTTNMKFLKFNLFNYNTNWGGTYIASGMKIKSFKIYENEKTIMDLIPVKRYDGVLGMYDKHNDKFYTNSGTGNFVAGKTVA